MDSSPTRSDSVYVIWDTAVFILMVIQGYAILWLHRRVAWLESRQTSKPIVIDEGREDG